MDFEKLLSEHIPALRRYVNFRLGGSGDAEDVFQEICLSACLHYTRLREEAAFKAWLFRIARNKIIDWRRTAAKENARRTESLPPAGLYAVGHSAVRETLDKLTPTEQEILTLAYLEDFKQAEIAELLKIPLGTVKSRLFNARESFKNKYPYLKGAQSMKNMNFPPVMPGYTITSSDEVPFETVHEGLMGWGIVPRLGEKCAWSAYDFPSRQRTETISMEVTNPAIVHGIDGVEIRVHEHGWDSDDNLIFAKTPTERTFIAQLTHTHVRYLAESHMENGVRKVYTFLDGDPFTSNWGYGEDNCGFETHIRQRGLITRQRDAITTRDGKAALDVCGRYTVAISGKAHDTICLTDCETYDKDSLSESYLDRDGNIVLWRAFRSDEWGLRKFGIRFSEKFPDNERLTVNGRTFVHWYDCLFNNGVV